MCYMNHRKFLDPGHKWRFDKKRFNGEIEMGTPLGILSRTDIEELLAGYENIFGKKEVKKHKNESPFKKSQYFLIYHVGVKMYVDITLMLCI